MRLRTRLFIWVGSLFVIVFLLSYVYEAFLTRRELHESASKLKSKIIRVNEEKRVELQKYLSEVLSESCAKVNSLLLRIRDYPPMRESFDPSLRTPLKSSWLDSATLISSNKWIDYIETKANGMQSSLIALAQDHLPQIPILEVEKGVWLAKSPREYENESLIAIPIRINELLANIPPIKLPQDQHTVSFYVLFHPTTIMNFDTQNIDFKVLNLSINPLEPFLHWVEAHGPMTPFSSFINDIERAKTVLGKDPLILNKKFKNPKINKKKVYTSIRDERLDSFISRSDQIGLLWGLSTLLASGPFGDNPFSSKAPMGIARQKRDEEIALTLLRKSVFFDRSFENLNEDLNKSFSNTLSVIVPEDLSDVYFGNGLHLVSKTHHGKVTLGINGGNILRDLALSTQKKAIFISKDKIISYYNEKGIKQSPIQIPKEEMTQLLSKPSGIFNFNGKEYYFLHVQPFEDLDFHFFVIETKAQEFLLIDALHKSAADLLDRISFNMRIAAVGGLFVVLVLLTQISRRVSKPISILADATVKVKEGKLEDVNIPKTKKVIKKDEVNILYRNFFDMVEGLKEKERVRGVLNKVVSSEIADEILKQDPHLGGEEKEVTVFFADIRSFTSLTEKMPPGEVIELLNTCMTKVSNIIDKCQGVIDKYVGDEVMALFGAPLRRPDSTLKAVAAALLVIKELKHWNVERVQNGLRELEMGIGIHRGQMVVGNMGAENRLNYTVLGSNVNLGARLCSAAKPMEVLISEEVYAEEKVKEHIKVEKVEQLKFQGFSSEYTAYRAIDILKPIDDIDFTNPS